MRTVMTFCHQRGKGNQMPHMEQSLMPQPSWRTWQILRKISSLFWPLLQRVPYLLASNAHDGNISVIYLHVIPSGATQSSMQDVVNPFWAVSYVWMHGIEVQRENEEMSNLSQ